MTVHIQGMMESPDVAWQEITQFLAAHPAIYRTRLRKGGSGVRFRAELTEEGHVRVTLQKGQQHILPERDFADLYALYFRREQGEAVTARALAASRYSSYFWGLIYWCQVRKEVPDSEAELQL